MTIEPCDAGCRITWTHVDARHSTDNAAKMASQIFTGLKTAAKRHIAEKTAQHFEDRDPGRLTEEDAIETGLWAHNDIGEEKTGDKALGASLSAATICVEEGSTES